MEIIYFSPFFGSNNSAAAIRAKYHVEALRKKGHSVKVLAAEDSTEATWVTFIKAPSNKAPFPVRLLIEMALGIELAFRCLTQDGFVLLSSPPYFSVLFCSLIIKLFRKEYALDIRDLYPEVLFDYGLVGRNSFVGKWLLDFSNAMYRGARFIVGVTNGVIDSIAENLGSRDNLHCIRNGFDSDLFYPSTENRDGPLRVIFHGNLGRFQNIELLIEVARRLETANARVEFTVVGSGFYEPIIQNCGLNSVRYLGEKTNREISELLRNQDLGVSFRTDSDYNRIAFPVKVFEYIGSGLPVISTPEGEAGFEIRKHDLGYEFYNSQIDKIVQAITELQNDPTLLSKLKSNTVRARSSFTRQSTSAEFADLFDII